MMLKKTTILIISMLLLLGCGDKKGKERKLNYSVQEKDGIRTYFNKTAPADDSFAYDFKEVLTIKGDPEGRADSTAFFSSSCE